LADPLLGRVIQRRFRLEERLGSGGMGVVYRARHLLIDRVVAIKILVPGKNNDHLRAWFLREARAANRINHAHIVDIYDYGETEEGLAYLVMEYLDGTPLNELVARGPVPLARAADILEQCCAALARAHDLGVIHRDFKPDNVFLLERAGRKDFVKILDFGLARLLQEASPTAKGAVFGTPEYMSPEQTLGQEARASSDLYSVGIVFYEMVTGRLPFEGPGREAVMEQHRTAAPVPPGRRVASLTPLADSMIMRLLEKDPGRRYRDAHHLLEDIKALQRMVPRNPWETAAEPRSRGRGGPRVEGVAAWSIRTAMFARMAARAFPNGDVPETIASRLTEMWSLSAVTARVEGETAADAAAVEAHERRSREFRAQIGRRVEELARDLSRGRGRLAEMLSDRERLERSVDDVRDEVSRLLDRITALEIAGDMGSELREAYQALGASEARLTAREEDLDRLKTEVEAIIAQTGALEAQMRSLRGDLEHHEDALDSEAATLRRRLAERSGESALHVRRLAEATEELLAALASRPECEDIVREMEELVGLNPDSRVPPARPARRAESTR
jgi:serine/threonine-protein kinase